MNDSRWKRIFKDTEFSYHQYIILCQLDNAILTGNKKSNILSEIRIPNPVSLILKNVFLIS